MNWRKELARCGTENDVVIIVQDYWREAPSWLKCFVPRDCHAHPVQEPADVLHWGIRLSHRFGDSLFRVTDIKVQELVVFLVCAASRIHELRGDPVSASAGGKSLA